MRRPLCNYANASNETSRADAIYQRGQYWIKKNNDRQGDRRRYGAYINDSLIGLGGSLVRVKRFVNDMYKAYPFETDVNEGLTKVQTFARRAQMTLRTQMTPSKAEPKKATPKKKTTKKVATGSKNSQASQPKKATGKSAAVRAGTLPVFDVTAGRVITRGKLNKEQADELQRFIESETSRRDLVDTMQNLDTNYEINNHFRRLFKVAQAKLKELQQTPTQGRLF